MIKDALVNQASFEYKVADLVGNFGIPTDYLGNQQKKELTRCALEFNKNKNKLFLDILQPIAPQ